MMMMMNYESWLEVDQWITRSDMIWESQMIRGQMIRGFIKLLSPHWLNPETVYWISMGPEQFPFHYRLNHMGTERNHTIFKNKGRNMKFLEIKGTIGAWIDGRVGFEPPTSTFQSTYLMVSRLIHLYFGQLPT